MLHMYHTMTFFKVQLSFFRVTLLLKSLERVPRMTLNYSCLATMPKKNLLGYQLYQMRYKKLALSKLRPPCLETLLQKYVLEYQF